MHATRFTAASVVVAVAGPVLAAGAAVLLPTSAAFAGSIAASALVGLVFAANNLQMVRTRGTASLPSATLAAVFGLWLTGAPLVYDAGFAPTAVVQLAGMLTAAFSTHTALEAAEAIARGEERGRRPPSVETGDVPGLADALDED